MLNLTLPPHVFGGMGLLLVAPIFLLQQIGKSMYKSSLLYLDYPGFLVDW
jgi:hypothetical protein